MQEANPSSIILKVVTESKKRKAAGGKKEVEEKKKKKLDHNNNASGSTTASSWRPPQQQYPPYQVLAPQMYWQLPQLQYGGYHQHFPPSALYNRQATQFRPQTKATGCFTCGEASHGFRRCTSIATPAAKPMPPPPQ